MIVVIKTKSENNTTHNLKTRSIWKNDNKWTKTTNVKTTIIRKVQPIENDDDDDQEKLTTRDGGSDNGAKRIETLKSMTKLNYN